jgi:hypothetical protein
MFTKQVSRPVDSLDSPSWPPRSSKGANSKKDLVTGPIGVFVPYRSARPPDGWYAHLRRTSSRCHRSRVSGGEHEHVSWRTEKEQVMGMI